MYVHYTIIIHYIDFLYTIKYTLQYLQIVKNVKIPWNEGLIDLIRQNLNVIFSWAKFWCVQFQKTKSTVILSPLIRGESIPVSVEVANGLLVDEVYGVLELRLVLMGKMRYKAGIYKTKHHGFYVNCDMLVRYKKGFVGQVNLLGYPDCQVDIWSFFFVFLMNFENKR